MGPSHRGHFIKLPRGRGRGLGFGYPLGFGYFWCLFYFYLWRLGTSCNGGVASSSSAGGDEAVGGRLALRSPVYGINSGEVKRGEVDGMQYLILCK